MSAKKNAESTVVAEPIRNMIVQEVPENATEVSPDATTEQKLAAEYVKKSLSWSKGECNGKYTWAKKLSDYLDSFAADPKKVKKEEKQKRTRASEVIGAEIASRLGRANAYSGSWVRNHVAGYKKFPQGITTPGEMIEFLSICSGNQGVKKDPNAGSPDGSTHAPTHTVTDPLQSVRNAVWRAMKKGHTVEEITDAVNWAIAHPA